ncbi:YaiO family outer membrane beta-barrel protein [Cellulophaga omnivescoria]|uniref:YaiO family outer membrane beta-barrel protein n=1 Tax=Cellulophaga omnivescoria TaxID=1888890 RepID=UPI0022F0F717|nr:YaiO family outer membrane beta-barrel protein [Cellulophaga omnivescoria]WBU89110.1 YaiO family outer membrane beta-barrel protein [Cellulophaga omnivescoria]
MKFSIYILLVFTFLVITTGNSQNTTYMGNPDASFLVARDLAFANKRKQARDTLKHILSKYPNYTDVENLLAKTLTWDAQYSKARLHYNNIITRDKSNLEVWIAAIKNELYAKNYNTALGLANKGLVTLKNNTELLELKNNAILELKKAESKVSQSTMVIDTTVVVNSDLKNAILLTTEAQSFNKVYNTMSAVSIAYKRTTKFGDIIPTINYSNRFNTNGIQYQLDAYPKLGTKMYAYASYAYSDSEIFPSHRIGGELYRSLPKSLEISVGARYLSYNSKNATVFTGSLSWYPGNYYLSWRPYINPANNSTISFSNSFTARRYLKDKYNYLDFQFGFGFSPETTQLTENNVLLSESIFYLESQEAAFTYNFTVKNTKNILAATLGVTRQELIFTPNEFYLAVTGRVKYQFNW